MKKVTIISIVAFSLVLAICASSAIAQEIAVKVIDPPRSQIEVRRSYKVVGTASIPSGTHLWVLTRREDFEGVWWPQNEGKVDPVSKSWKVSVNFGNPGKRPFNPIFTSEARHGIYSFNYEEDLCLKIISSLIPSQGTDSGSTTLNNGKAAD
jgi:hypothetical protein